MRRPPAAPALPWAVAGCTALAVAGPALGPGLLLNLDLVVTHDPPVPPGVWGLGPELPRGVPYQVPLAWLSTVLDGALVGKAVLVAALVVAFVGAHRLAVGAPAVARLAAGLVYAAGPFLATRLAIGHVGTGMATAVLPWALPTLLQPGRSGRRTLAWCAALGFWGVNGGILAGAAVLVGLVADRGRRAPAVGAAWLLGQLPWLVPGVVVATQGIDPAGAENFATRLDGPLGLLRLVGGQGYFIEAFDIGASSAVVPLVAGVLAVAAAFGHGRLPPEWRGRALPLAAVGLLVVVASGLPGVDRAYAAAADSPLGLPLREGHRVLGLFLVWLAPAAAHGFGRADTRLPGAAIGGLGLSLALIGPSLWGFGGQVRPFTQPGEWAEARRLIRADPGPVMALPWGQYVQPDVADGVLVHQPLPYVFGGDVLVASAQGDEDAPQERPDPRLPLADDVAAAFRSGEPASDGLRALGIRWVARLTTPNPSYDDIGSDPALEEVVAGPDLTLFRVVDASPSAVDGSGEAVDLATPLGPLARPDGDAAFTWYRTGSDGWLRGWAGTSVTAEGNLAVPAGGGSLWYWPSLLVLAADGITVGALLVARRRDQ